MRQVFLTFKEQRVFIIRKSHHCFKKVLTANINSLIEIYLKVKQQSLYVSILVNIYIPFNLTRSIDSPGFSLRSKV